MTSSNVACPSSRAVLTSGARRSDKEAGATMSGQCAWFMTDLATEPDQGAIHLSGTPAESITEAAECRSVCKPDRAWKPGANRGSLERTQRIAWVAALAQLGREHIRRPVPGRACPPPIRRLPSAYLT